MSLTYWNGRLVPREEVRLPANDSGFLFGDGLFETLRVDAGHARDVEAHLDRLVAGLRRIRLGIPEDRRGLRRAVTQVAADAPTPVARMRITITRDTRLVTTALYEPPGEDLYRNGVAVRLLPQYRIDSGGPLVGLKSLSYQANRLALVRAETQGAWEALLVNEAGRLVEGTRTNVALVFPEGVFTPPRTDGCLPGTVRRRLLEQEAIREWPLSPEDLANASEVLLMNSLIGVLPVSQINGKEVSLGPVAGRLRTLTSPALLSRPSSHPSGERREKTD